MPTMIRVKIKETGLIVRMGLEEYLRGVVPAEVSASWPEAVLQAQAIAARTYALDKIRARKAKEFDVDNTTSYQAYNPAKAHPRSDAAIRATAGQALTYNGKVLDTCVYCASNGGQIRSAKEVWGGNRAYLIARKDPFDARAGKKKNGHGVGMSQYGARQMATEGKDCETILAFYYPGAFITQMEE